MARLLILSQDEINDLLESENPASGAMVIIAREVVDALSLTREELNAAAGDYDGTITPDIRLDVVRDVGHYFVGFAQQHAELGENELNGKGG